MAAKTKRCKDCEAEGITNIRPAPHAGPRCTTHHRMLRNKRRGVSWEGRIWGTYHLTPERYWAIYEAQGRRCVFCPRNGRTKKLSVDHDHSCCSGPISCGECVRGLLCSTCNSYLGHIRDNPDVGQLISEYLRDPPAKKIAA